MEKTGSHVIKTEKGFEGIKKTPVDPSLAILDPES